MVRVRHNSEAQQRARGRGRDPVDDDGVALTEAVIAFAGDGAVARMQARL